MGVGPFFRGIVDCGGQVLTAAARRTDQQHARPAGGGQFHLTAGESHGGALADQAIGPIASGRLLVEMANVFVQSDCLGGTCFCVGSITVRPFVGRLNNRHDAEEVVSG